MSLALVRSRALDGLDAPEVTVEVHLANGLPAFSLVGLPDTEVREARDRVRAALQTSQFEFPQRRITVNLAPADLPKEGGRSIWRSRWAFLSPPARSPAGCSTGWSSAASCRSMASCARCAACLPWRWPQGVRGAVSWWRRPTRPKRRWRVPRPCCRRPACVRWRRTSMATRRCRRPCSTIRPLPPRRARPTLPMCAGSSRRAVRWK